MPATTPFSIRWAPLRTGLSLCVAAIGCVASSSGAAEYFDEAKAVTVFAFDDVSIPHTQNLKLEMRTPERYPDNPVVRRGPPGSPDALGVQFYGSVIREGGRFRMWYVAFDDDATNPVPSARWRAAYAESSDGLHWMKPTLGLVDYKGSKDNNLILTDPSPLGFVNLKVLADADDPDPRRRYKISTHVYFRHNTRLGTLAPFASADGLHWKLLTDATPRSAELRKEDLVLPAVHFEPCGGLYQWDGLYYICGQNAMAAPRPYHGRVVRLYRSSDFVHWSATSSIAFVRTPQHTLLGPGRSREGEQNHEGISVWNRRNLLLGLSGRWHGALDWGGVTVDLGFVISNDGVHFREPLHEWTFLRRGEDGAWDQGGVLQGQGFENIGDQTWIYYGAWDPRHREKDPARGGVGIAMLPRDRFGDLVVDESGKGPGDYQTPEITSDFITTALTTPSGAPVRFHLNADGLGAGSALKVEILDAQEHPLPGCSGADAAVVRESGFQVPVAWRGQTDLSNLPERIRLHITFDGKRNTAIRFSALYMTAGRQQ